MRRGRSFENSRSLRCSGKAGPPPIQDEQAAGGPILPNLPIVPIVPIVPVIPVVPVMPTVPIVSIVPVMPVVPIVTIADSGIREQIVCRFR